MEELIPQGKRLFFIALLVMFACEEEEKDFAGIINPSSICGVDTSFSRVIQGTGGYDIIRSSNCSYMVCGTDGKTMLLKIDERGDEIWNRTYSEISGSHWGNAVNNTTDGGYIIGGKQNVIKADSLGEMEWFKQLSYSVAHYVEDVMKRLQVTI